MQKYFLLLFIWIPYLLVAQNDELSPELKNEVDSLQEVLKETKADSISKKIELLEAIAKPYRIKNSELALDYLQEALQLAKTHTQELKSANLYSEIGQIYVKEGDLYKAMQYFNQAIEIMKTLPPEELNHYIYIDIGNVYYAEKIYDAAIPYYQKALNGFQSKLDSNGISLSYRNLGICYRYQNSLDSALTLFHQSIEYMQAYQLEEKGICYNYLAITHRAQKDYQAAIDWSKKAIELDLSRTTQSGFSNPSSYFNLGLYYEEAGLIDSAIIYYKTAQDLGFNQPVNTISMAACYAKLGQTPKARALLNHWITDSTALKQLHLYDQQAFFSTRVEISIKENNWKAAYQHQKDYADILKGRLKNKPQKSNLLKFSKATANIQKDFELQQKEVENQYQKEINQKQAQLSSIYLWGLVFVGILLIILTYSFWNIRKFNKEIKTKNATIAENNRQLEAFNQTQTKLFSIIAHDLRTPFGQLIGFSEQILKQGPEQWNSTQQKVKTMGSSARQAYFLFEDLLGWARTQTGDLNTQKEKLYLPELIRKAQAPIQSLLAAKSIQLQIINQEVYWLDADPYMLQTILRNILSNAIRYSPKASIISIELSKQSDRALFKVKDQGTGIPLEALEKLFDEDKWITSNSNSGLGLVLCKEFVEAHQGQIRAYNQNGAIFEFDMPLATGQLPKKLLEDTEQATAILTENWSWEKVQQLDLKLFKEKVEQLEIFDATTIAKMRLELRSYKLKTLTEWIDALEDAAYEFDEKEFERLKALFLSKI